MAKIRASFLRFIANRRGVAAVEFAICSLAIFAFLMGLLNLGLLGFQISLQARATQATARAATVAVSKYYTANSAYDCLVADTTGYSTISTLYDSFTSGTLPASGTSAGSNPQLTATWYTTPTSATPTPALPPGIALVLTSKFTWHPIGMSGFGGGITMKVTTVAMVMGTSGSSATTTNCGGTS
jgi:Flp pilus assembly protein TadG